MINNPLAMMRDPSWDKREFTICCQLLWQLADCDNAWDAECVALAFDSLLEGTKNVVILNPNPKPE